MLDVAFTADEWGYAAALSTVLLVVMVCVSGLALVGRSRGGSGNGGQRFGPLSQRRAKAVP
jgi:ABC-type spermidine/putrescine transport system permease subunit I